MPEHTGVGECLEAAQEETRVSEMSNELVEVDKPGDFYHGHVGSVVQCLSGNRYTVEFPSDDRHSGYRKSTVKDFDGRNLRALITTA
jgi:hypothetical protein